MLQEHIACNTIQPNTAAAAQQQQNSGSKSEMSDTKQGTVVAGAHPRAGIPSLLAASTRQVQNVMDLVGSCTQAADMWLLPPAAGACCCYKGPVTLPSVGLLPLQ